MLRKKEVYTVITPIPGFIPRQLAIDILHAHSEVITLNPLVLEHKAIPPPRHAASDEYYSTWYEVTQRIQWIPGTGKMGSGKITFNGCFHNMPWGLQTHMYAPASVDLKNKYRIGGNQPGIEPPEHREMGLENLGAPKDGLYLREDIEVKCNITMIGFVTKELKAASKEMVSRIIKKAELLDAGVLQAMMQDGKLKTVNPNDRSEANWSNRQDVVAAGATAPPAYPGQVRVASPQMSSVPYHVQGTATPPPPQMIHEAPALPIKEQVFGPIEMSGNDTYIHPPAPSPNFPQQQQQQQQPQYPQQQQQHHQQYSYQPASPQLHQHQQFQQFQADVSPIDHQQQPYGYQPAPSLQLHQQQQQSQHPADSGITEPNRSSISSTSSSGHGGSGSGTWSPMPGQTFSSELAAHPETREEHRQEP